jgi:multidrug efflux pump subunit AcrA (membrane-fusion protein)
MQMKEQAEQMAAAQQAAAQQAAATAQQASDQAAAAGGPDYEPIAGVSLEQFAEICKGLAAHGHDQSKGTEVAASKGVSADGWQAARRLERAHQEQHPSFVRPCKLHRQGQRLRVPRPRFRQNSFSDRRVVTNDPTQPGDVVRRHKLPEGLWASS